MNREMMNRIREANKYQKMAVRALFSEQTAEHIGVIENEIKAMLMECVMEKMKNKVSDFPDAEKDSAHTSERVKKVDIG